MKLTSIAPASGSILLISHVRVRKAVVIYISEDPDTTKNDTTRFKTKKLMRDYTPPNLLHVAIAWLYRSHCGYIAFEIIRVYSSATSNKELLLCQLTIITSTIKSINLYYYLWMHVNMHTRMRIYINVYMPTHIHILLYISNQCVPGQIRIHENTNWNKRNYSLFV